MFRLLTASTAAAKPNSGPPRGSGGVTVSPCYFALVMATGIVSLAAHLHGMGIIASGLFWLNVGTYVLLWVLTLVRLACFRAQFIGEPGGHSRAATFLTMTAGTCVLGCQFALLTPWISVARVLWFFGAGLWFVLSYAFFVAMTVGETKPPLEAGISGAWLLVIVATESLSVLGTLVAPSPDSVGGVFLIALAAYLVGALLYVFFATLILYRWMFFSMTPDKLTPDYWINMGASAITTLAGALLLHASGQWKLLQRLAPLLTGATLLFWAMSTW